jgi:hypothetical protein
MTWVMDVTVTPSALALAAVLEERGTEAEAIRARVHRTALWSYCTGRRLPDAKRVAMFHRITGGRVAADGWVTDSEAA